MTDTLPAGLSAATWTCTASPGSSCTASGSGSLSTTANLEVGDSAIYTITATLAPGFTGTLSNTATVAGPATIPELNAANNSATAAVLAEPRVNLGVTKTDGAPSAVPGTNVTYTIVASNAGPSTATGALITDALPAGATSGSWSCTVGSGGSCGAASGTLPMSTTATLAPSGSVTYTVAVAVSSTATGSLANSVTIAAPAGAVETNSVNNVATDTDTLTPTADLSITKTDATMWAVPGQSTTYTVVVTNDGPSDVTGATVTDTMPAGVTSMTWTCAGASGGSCPAAGSGSISDNVDLPVGASITYTVTAAIAAATGTLTNTTTVVAPLGVTDTNAANNSATDIDALTPRADLVVTKDDGVTSIIPGQSTTYTVILANTGPSDAPATIVTDFEPADAAFTSWTCTPAAGAGDINTAVSLSVGGTATFTVTADVAASATGTLSNTATVAAPPATTDPNAANNSATDVDTLVPEADLSVTKTHGLTSAVPGAAISYTIDVTNSGPSSAVGVAISDILPSTLAGATWSCTATAGSACGNSNGIGDIAETVDVAAGGTVSFLVTATIAADATGTLSNTVTVVSPAGFTDSNPANDSATDVTDLAPAVDLAVTKTDGQATAIPGTPISYTVTVTNAGPSASAGSRVLDNLPAVLTGTTWTCNAAPGSLCGAASGSGSIDQIVTVGVGSSITYTVSATVSASAVGVLVNAATVTPAVGVTDSNAGNNSAIDTDVLTPQVNLTVVKTDGAASVVPGTATTYSIIVANAGPSAVADAAIVDALSAALTNASWTCAGAAGGFCGAASGTGAIATTAALPPGAAVAYTLTATIDPSATGTVANTATVAAPAGVVDPDTADNSSTDTDTLTPSVDLSITKTDGVATAVHGAQTTYTITVANSGPSAANGADISDVLPAEIVAAAWTCTATGGATCGIPNGSGDVLLPADLPAGGSVTIDVVADIDPAASGFVVNTATVTEPAGVIDTNAANDAATDSDTLIPIADLLITKDDGLVSALPGDPVSYAVVVTNNGPSAVVGASVTDVMPAGLSGVVWTCTADPNSACVTTSGTGDIATTVDLASGETAAFTIDATVAASQLGAVTNTATIDAPPGVSDPNSANNLATDTTIVNGLGDVSITKTDGVTTVVAGTSTTYTIVVTNPGPSRIDGIQVIDALPAGLVSASWTCAPTGAAVCGAATGTGSINEMIDMPAASTVTFTVTADVAPTASGTVSNTASVTLPTNVVDPDPANNAATDITDIERVADLVVTKTDHVSALTPGNSVSYDITVVNGGPSAVTGATLTDVVPSAITGAGWTCTTAAGATCGAPAGSGNISLNVDLTVGASVVVRITGTVSPNATGTLVNTAAITPPAGVDDPDGANNTASDSDTLDPVADVSVAKSNDVTSQSPGATSSYTITVANAGPSSAPGVTIDDPLPAGVTTASWTCSAAAGSSCAAASGSGAINTTVDLAAAGTVTFTVSLQASPAAGTLTNTVMATVAAGITDPDPSNNVASDTDTLVFTADLDVTKTSSAAAVAPGQSLNYTVVVSNNGPDPATDVTVLDTMPAGLANTTWTCAATFGSSCPAVGTGDIAVTIDLAAGGSAIFAVTTTATTVAASTIVNTATAAVGPGTIDPDPTNNTASSSVAVDRTFSLSVRKTASVTTVQAGDTFSYNIVVSNAGSARLDSVVISDPVPAGLIALSWTCFGAAGGICNLAAGTGSPLLTADLPLGGSVTITLFVQAAADASGPIVNVVTATAGSSSQQVTAQASASVEVSPVVPATAALSITKSTSATTYSTVGSIVTFTLVATNTGNATLSNVTITDPNATVTGCAPVGLAPGQTLTCSAAHVVTQIDLDQGAVTNTASVTAVSPTGSAVTASSATVVVPATRITTLSLAKSTSASDFANVGEKISYSIAATNTGNVTLMNVAISDPNAVLTDCAPTNLAPGQTITCTAVHTVTAADIAAKVILNQAHATALPAVALESVCPFLGPNRVECPGDVAISADSNTVVLNRARLLPTAGGNVASNLILAVALLGFGGLLLVGSRRRTRRAR